MAGLDFERPILELERKIEELRHITTDKEIIKRLELELERKKNEIYQNLTAWQRVKIARHPQRPFTQDYINMILMDFYELHGDRLFSDDPAIIAGLGRIDNQKILLIGHQKGRDTKENILCNFGCAHPEGYRKALRLMQMAQKFNLPIVALIDTPGAYPGIGAEERGQAQAIALNLREMAAIAVPIIVIVIGEGGSGGALGIGIGDRVCVMENAYYSVISPEGCAAILWKDSAKAPEAAEALKLTAMELLNMGIIDDVVSEPQGGAHRDPQKAAQNLKKYIKKYLEDLKEIPLDKLLSLRYQKFRKIGAFA
jgi:acetyl-CoA carboxylase carboxyl transferase subunit alpha